MSEYYDCPCGSTIKDAGDNLSRHFSRQIHLQYFKDVGRLHKAKNRSKPTQLELSDSSSDCELDSPADELTPLSPARCKSEDTGAGESLSELPAPSRPPVFERSQIRARFAMVRPTPPPEAQPSSTGTRKRAGEHKKYSLAKRAKVAAVPPLVEQSTPTLIERYFTQHLATIARGASYRAFAFELSSRANKTGQDRALLSYLSSLNKLTLAEGVHEISLVCEREIIAPADLEASTGIVESLARKARLFELI